MEASELCYWYSQEEFTPLGRESSLGDCGLSLSAYASSRLWLMGTVILRVPDCLGLAQAQGDIEQVFEHL